MNTHNGVRGLALAFIAIIAFAATSAEAKPKRPREAPTAEAASAGSFVWDPSTDFIVITDCGVIDGNLCPKKALPAEQGILVWQMSNRCLTEILDRVENAGSRRLGIAFKITAGQTAGSAVSVLVSFKKPNISLFRQVVGLTLFPSAGANYMAAGEQIMMILGGGHADCTKQFVERNSSSVPDAFIVPLPTLRTTFPDIAAPVAKEPASDSGS